MVSRTGILTLIAAAALAGCGESKPTAPGKLDIADVTASAQRVLGACEPGGKGDDPQIKDDIDRLVEVYDRSDPDARFQLDGGGETVTMRTVLRAAHNLLVADGGPCSVALDAPVTQALGKS